ncbi:MAG: methylenetetrahydrofolate reductase [NAD(P)H] [Planctomycetia bacterium]|nr:methylenetetrahydrofolate reductase [NAD(P)H] [Planctomycetia bacterium]
MRIAELYARPEPTVSFEFFPPKSDEAEAALFRETIPELQRLKPAFCSVTYGAGGSTRDRTLRMVARVRREFGIEAMSHLTCVGSTREQLGDVLDQARELGIENILALRGDPPRGETTFKPTAGGFGHAVELIGFVKARKHFAIGGAFYPEGHIECGDKQLDWDRAAAKVEAGADFLISQLFYDANDFLECADYLRNRRGVKVPIVPGVLPFLSAEQIKRFTSLCGAKLSAELLKRLESLAHDDEAVRQLGVEVCTDLCRRLLDAGAPGIHVYSLNRVPSTRELLTNLGLGK